MDTSLQCILSAKRSRSRGFAINWTTFHFKICWWFREGKDLNLDRVSTCWTAFSQSVLTNESIKAMWQVLFLDTSENTEIPPDLLVWKICRNSQFLQSFRQFRQFRQFTQNSTETRNFHHRKLGEITIA